MGLVFKSHRSVFDAVCIMQDSKAMCKYFLYNVFVSRQNIKYDIHSHDSLKIILKII